MAEEAVKLPGTDLSLVDIPERSWRLDHPNFANVYKTTFAKGVIKDFKKITDDPIEVVALVKVEIEGMGESEFIPLFYHPKAQYWDDYEAEDAKDGAGLATEFDQKKGCFKKAWMSFRCDDEVAVMLNEGVPVAVVGFADGVPRVGEDIVKVVAPTWQGVSRFFHLQCSRFKVDPVDFPGEEAGLYGGLDVEKKGPDDLDLGLVLENESGPENYYQRPASQYYPDSSGDERDFGWLTNYEQPQPGGSVLHREVYSNKQQYLEFVFIVGPILCIVQVLGSSATSYWDSFDLGYGNNPPYHFEPTNGIPLDQGLRVVSAGDCPYSPVPQGLVTGPNAWFITDIQCRAALYSKELLDAIESAPPVSAQQAYTAYAAHGWNYEWGTKYAGTVWQRKWDTMDLIHVLFSFSTWPKWDDTKFIVRPHTKEELQAAGMWPYEEEEAP